MQIQKGKTFNFPYQITHNVNKMLRPFDVRTSSNKLITIIYIYIYFHYAHQLIFGLPEYTSPSVFFVSVKTISDNHFLNES